MSSILQSASYSRNTYEVKAARLTGSPAETDAVCEWLVEQGYPWIHGSYMAAKSSSDIDLSPGIWIDPTKRWPILHVRSAFRDPVFPDHIRYRSIEVDNGDWIVIMDSGEVRRMSHGDFERKFHANPSSPA